MLAIARPWDRFFASLGLNLSMVKALTDPRHPPAPDFEPIVRAWRITGIFYFCLGAGILAFGCGLLLYVTLYENNPSGFSTLAKIAGGLVAVTSLGLFKLGNTRFEKIGIIQTLRLRWITLAAGRGSGREIAELNRMVNKMLRDNLARGL